MRVPVSRVRLLARVPPQAEEEAGGEIWSAVPGQEASYIDDGFFI